MRTDLLIEPYQGDPLHPKLVVPLLISVLALLLGALFWLPAAWPSPEGEYTYYAYMPPSVCNLSKQIYVWGGIAETIKNYTAFPSNLDIVGVEDGTSYSLYDLSTKGLLRSGSLSKYEHVRIQFGSRRTSTEPFEVQDYYIKLVTDKPVSALVWGGFIWGIPGFDRPYSENYTLTGFSTYLPAVDNTLIGREFIFMSFPTYWEPKIYIGEVNKYNIFAAQDSKVRIYDAAGNLLEELDVARQSMARTRVLEPWKVYRITSTGNIMVLGGTLNSMAYVPALTGGYVGTSFMAMRTGSYQSLQSFLAVALQDAKIELWDMRKPSGSPPERTLNVKQDEMVFDTSLQWDIPVMMKSTGNITLLCGGNNYHWGATWTSVPGFVLPQYIAEDIALLGAKPGQKVGFYAPYQGIIFASGDTEVEVNGIPRSMKKDDFVTVSSGTFTVRPSSAAIIIEILGDTNVNIYADKAQLIKSFDNWGHYLISPQGLYGSYVFEEGGGALELLLYGAIAGIAAVAAVAVVMVVRKRKNT